MVQQADLIGVGVAVDRGVFTGFFTGGVLALADVPIRCKRSVPITLIGSLVPQRL